MKFRVINVTYQKARKAYKYYGGKIIPGTYYYRGFGVYGNEPFEFFFTDDDIFNSRKIAIRILYDEYVRYWNRRYLQELGVHKI